MKNDKTIGEIISKLDQKFSLDLNGNNYDAIMCKSLSATDLGTNPNSHQAHIAISNSEMMDIFPIIDIEHYKSSIEDSKTNTIAKSFYYLELPVTLFKQNLQSLVEGNNSTISEVINTTFQDNPTISKDMSVVLNRRKNSKPQIELSGEFKSFIRKIAKDQDILVIAKEKCKLHYKALIINANDPEANFFSNTAIFDFKPQNKTAVNVQDYHTDSPIKDGKNIIYYGAPGTGKSYSINNIIKETYSDYDAAKDNNDNIFRVTLHPEYTYTDFVGQLLPHSDDQKNVNYQFTPGIFTNALKQAEDHKDEKIYLVLEEMSRANVAAVFGDLFQLLDRKNGSSEYAINNEEIAKIVYKDPKHKVIIPSNMTILGTVNTSDQNVFVMDTAFKRRFDWKYVSTDAGADSEDFKNKNNPKIDIGDGIDASWKDLYQALNRFIVGDLGLSEDKQIGPYFIKFEGADSDTSHELIKDKLLQYLWEDINSAAMEMYTSSNRLFEDRDKISSFSDLYNKFDKKEKVFSDSFIKSLGVSDIENSSED